MPNGMGKPVQQFVIWVSIAGQKWMRWSRLYDFTAGQFKKGVEAIVILINFPSLRDLNYGLFLTIYPQAQYIELLLKKMPWKVI